MSDDFVVNDKRLFAKDGQVKSSAAEAAPEPSNEPSKVPPRPEQPAERLSAAYLPPANLTALLVGLASSAFIHLGQSQEPGPAPPVDLPAAKHAIDLLAVLQLKTKGNLEPEEDSLLGALLYDLRLKFVEASSKKD
ncbi:MAG: DUF1844 domain-containing protein [Candidatus Adiutrix sp.]|jgi:hypothetical protein|nr:DUF1844 domain-containing protein [Candidatus Adiutrix sp.]